MTTTPTPSKQIMLRLNDREKGQILELAALMGARSMAEAIRVAVDHELIRVKAARNGRA